MKKNILITGGAGFIGSHVVRLLVSKYPNYQVINLDKLTYAGNLANLKDVENASNYKFVKVDICDFDELLNVFKQYEIDGVIHLAAESHVDRSIKDPFTFARTNVLGTLSLLQAAKVYWESLPEKYAEKRFYHISTDEVYGTLDFDGTFVRAYHDTYGMPTIVTNCSNNYGPYQFPEKLIPLFINNIRYGKSLPVYGKGENVRDWLFVEDHARAIDLIKIIIKTVDKLLGHPEGCSDHLITYVTDRAGHDLRYAIDSTKLKNELGWEPSLQFEEGIEKTVRWYLDNQDWMDNVVNGGYEKYYEEMCKNW